MSEVNGVKVTLNETPSVQVVKVTETTVTDALGRSIKLKKPSPLANLDFAKAVGSDGNWNRVYMVMVSHLIFVAAIDDVPVAVPSSEGELRALYQRLGDEGNALALQVGPYGQGDVLALAPAHGQPGVAGHELEIVHRVDHGDFVFLG